jgi:FSR family fosmidomycin resistance protein-like MFS transporter
MTLLIALVLFYPASGAFVNLSQASLMDAEPEKHEQNMVRWTFSGSLGIVIGPLFLGLSTYLRGSWRVMFLVLAIISAMVSFLVKRFPFSSSEGKWDSQNAPKNGLNFMVGVRNAFDALK